MSEHQTQQETTRNDWENPSIIGRNKQAAHATLVPYPDEKTALTGDRSTSPYSRWPAFGKERIG
jgi:hypothetical protein